LLAIAVLLAALALLLPRPLLAPLGALLGWSGALVVAHFASARRRFARRFLKGSNGAEPGRIREHRNDDGVAFELPVDGLEPWGSDAWIIAVSSAAAWMLANLTGRGMVFGFIAVLVAAAFARLWSVRNDHLRIEVSSGGFRVDSCEGGRVAQRVGKGALLPELRPDGLTLWSSSGRIGVLRGELLPQERAWLAERLAALAGTTRSSAGEPEEQVDERDSGKDGERQQREHAE